MASTLVKTPHSEEFLEYVEEDGIEHFRIIVPAHKNPSSVIPIDILFETLKIILNRGNYPLLIHCNKGKVRAKVPGRLRSHLISTTASDRVHDCLLSEIAGVDRCCHHHGVRSSQLPKLSNSAHHVRLTLLQVPQIRRGQISPSRRSIYCLLQCRSGAADSRWLGCCLRTSSSEPAPGRTRKPAAFPLEHACWVFSASEWRLSRRSSYAATL